MFTVENYWSRASEREKEKVGGMDGWMDGWTDGQTDGQAIDFEDSWLVLNIIKIIL